jgi:predicted helicase
MPGPLKATDAAIKAYHAAMNLFAKHEATHFLNTVYEWFLQGYSVKTADTHGMVYTPQPIVDFMCVNVEEVLKTEFGLTLGLPDVSIFDPSLIWREPTIDRVRSIL